MLPPPAALLAQVSPESVGVGIGIGFIVLLVLAALLALAAFAFWVWMLVDCAQAPEPLGDSNHRLVWILILVFTGWLGAILYFFLVRRPRLAAARARGFTSPPMPHSPNAR